MRNSLQVNEDSFRFPCVGETVRVGNTSITCANALDCYSKWPSPTVIIVDGPYGVAGFPGDLATPYALAEWYAPHIAEWARYALPETTLWFWGTEIGWAEIHPVLNRSGWNYEGLQVWDKGIGHIAGNVNSKTIRGFPVVTEVCARYSRRVMFEGRDGRYLTIAQWLRAEWLRSGLPLCRTNDACDVKNAATRKYFTQDHLWYFPPPEMMEKLAAYANQWGRRTAIPYFSLDGSNPLTAAQWARMRSKWHHVHGWTNVWSIPALRGSERIKQNGKVVHSNQKPLSLVRLLIETSTDAGDVVWDPFSGLATVGVACEQLGRRCFSSEISSDVWRVALRRLREERLPDGMKEGAV